MFEEKMIVSHEDIAAAWLDKWSAEFDAHATKKEGFAIPDSELPREEEVMDIIIETIVTQGDFCVMHDEECSCYRFAYMETEYSIPVDDKWRKDVGEISKVLEDMRNKAALDNARETAERLIKKGKMTLEEIADCVSLLSLDELREIEMRVTQLA